MMQTLTISVANTFHSFIVALVVFFFLFLSLHSVASLRSVAAGHITHEALLMGQQCKAETIHGFIPCSLQSKTSLLAWTAAHASALFFFLVFALNPSARLLAVNLVSNSSWNWDSCSVGLGQWWGLQKLVSRCPGRFICSKL